jgi:hypothetical protein
MVVAGEPPGEFSLALDQRERRRKPIPERGDRQMRRSTERGRRERRFSPAQAVAWFQKKEVASMKGFLTKLGIASVLATFILASVSFWVQAAEKKRLTWTNKRGPIITYTIVYPGDDPKYTIGQSVRMDTTTSQDPDYNDAQSLVYSQSDDVAGSGSHRGYIKRVHKNGDETYTKYEGTHKRTKYLDINFSIFLLPIRCIKSPKV